MCIHTAYKILTEKIHQAIPHIPMQTVLRLQKEAPWTDSFHISLSIVLPYIPLQLSSHSVQTNFGSDCPCQQNTRDRDRALTDPEAIGGPLMYRKMKFVADSLRLDSILLTEGSILGDLGIIYNNSSIKAQSLYLHSYITLKH
jgi:hypothetical protein